MKAQVLSVEGKKLREIMLPQVFETTVDSKLIQRAVLAIESAGLQPKGIKLSAGRNKTAVYIGSRGKPQPYRTINVGRARLPRLKNRRNLLSGNVAMVPQAVGGPRAHPPKVEKRIKEKINKKEKQLALKSAIAACALSELVLKRGHKISSGVSLPVVVENKFESLSKTKDVLKVLEALSLGSDIERAKGARKRRSGAGKKRGRKYKKAKSVLIVVGDSKNVYRAARNIEGVNVTGVKDLNAKMLAPGAAPARLVLWSEDAIKFLGGAQ